MPKYSNFDVKLSDPRSAADDEIHMDKTTGFLWWKKTRRVYVYGSCTVWQWGHSGRGCGVFMESWLHEKWSHARHKRNVELREQNAERRAKIEACQRIAEGDEVVDFHELFMR